MRKLAATAGFCKDLKSIILKCPLYAPRLQSSQKATLTLSKYRKDETVFVKELFMSPVKDDFDAVPHFAGIQHIESPGPVPGSH